MSSTHTSEKHGHNHVMSAAGVLIALGIIYGDIGTSVLYVFKAIIGTDVISKQLVYGGMSCVFWTLTLVTTFKYVYLALNADNRGEGGIFALYALVRRHKTKWVIFPAIIGAASLIADGFITPPISIASAVEGLEFIPALEHIGIKNYILPLIYSILVALFVIQQFGTNVIGRAFGPIMFFWFTTMAVMGLVYIVPNPGIFAALSPHYAIDLLVHYPKGFVLLGAVFLCTTGAEALYSDLGHCGKQNIRVSWVFVKIALIINYLGQCAYLMGHEGQTLAEVGNGTALPPFYGMMSVEFRPFGVVIATLAAIIASQALITGTFTLANEAMKLKLFPNMKVHYPAQLKGQIYIAAMNWILLAGCILVVAVFKESSAMEAAYGLAITINLLMTTSLLTWHLYLKHKKDHSFFKNPKTIAIILLIFLVIESAFFLSGLAKFFHGGWFTCMIALFLFGIMYVMYQARLLREKYTDYVAINDEIKDTLNDLSRDYTVPREATNLVYLCMSGDPTKIDQNIIYSITKKRPKRADTYWFLHVDISDDPSLKQYTVDEIIPKKCYFIRLSFGFKVPHKVNLMFRHVVDELIEKGKVDALSHYPGLKKHNIKQDFKFILLNSRVSVDEELSPFNQFVIRAYRLIKRFSLSPEEHFNLESTNIEVERVPINIGKRATMELEGKFHFITPVVVESNGKLHITGRIDDDEDGIAG